ncbi:hypothetical protein chiPu_0028383 [Chiloscyllium punctatum]|uniref:Uncharacterized protein n=1 Tax=Chiloscyllium punctatum TaxID=137246 RepID=A0A401TPD6_CHIPU|nr:hypothetical protein [Chiloscyllium punctatum]
MEAQDTDWICLRVAHVSVEPPVRTLLKNTQAGRGADDTRRPRASQTNSHSERRGVGRGRARQRLSSTGVQVPDRRKRPAVNCRSSGGRCVNSGRFRPRQRVT